MLLGGGAQGEEVKTALFSSQTGKLSLGAFSQYLVDHEGKLTFEEIRGPQSEPLWQQSHAEVPSFGFAPGTYWFKVRILNESRLRDLFFEVGIEQIDWIELYYPVKDGSYHKKVSGDQMPFSQREISYRLNTFNLTLEPGVAADLYIKTRTEGAQIYPMTLWQPATFAAQKTDELFCYGLSYGLVFVMICYNFVLWLSLRDRNYIYYVFYLLFYGLSQLSLSGLGMEWLWGEWPFWTNISIPFFISLNAACMLELTRKFMDFAKAAPSLDRFFKAFSVATVGLAALALFAPYVYMVKAVAVVAAIVVICCFAVALMLFGKGYRFALLYLLAFACFLFGAALFILRNTSILPANFFTEYMIQFGVNLQVILLSLALGHRIRLEQERQQRAIEELNIGLEKQVEERTRRIADILHHVKFGFMLIDRECRVKEGFTASCSQILGRKIEVGSLLLDLMTCTERDREHFEAAFTQIFEETLPDAVALSNLPRKFKIDDRTIALDSALIRDDKGAISSVLITLSDASKMAAIEEKAGRNQVLINILSFKDSFRSFVADVRASFEVMRSAIINRDFSELYSILHTLKGSSASFGLSPIAALIHNIEEQHQVSVEDLDLIEKMLRDFLRENSTIIGIEYGKAGNDVFEVNLAEIGELRGRMNTAESLNDFISYLKEWLLTVTARPVHALLGPIDRAVARMAEAHGKEVSLKLKGGEIKVTSSTAHQVLKQLIHVIRNAVVHGIEHPSERVGKSACGSIFIDVSRTESPRALHVTVADDGRGIDVMKVARKALDNGLVTADDLKKMSHEEILQIIFLEGFSTMTMVDELSGRGVGLFAIKKSLDDVGGRIKVKTSIGFGTTFEIMIPG
jgi:HPt (histidine-containing phosphotransfer) domain-containing protein